jgi:sulfonate transport system ATP-binding protein
LGSQTINSLGSYEIIKNMMSHNLIINNLNKAFEVNRVEVNVLNNVNIDIQSGEFICIVGHSGCGKSTLLKIIAGLLDCNSGLVELGGKVIQEPDIGVGMIFQEHRLFPWLTIKENVALGLHHISRDKKNRIVSEYLALVNLTGFENAYPHQLSGGMAQRASIARSLVNDPKVLLLDEPFGALDALTRIQMQREILRIWEKKKATMILVTHDIDEAIYLGDRVVVMSSRPGTILDIFQISLPRPRDRADSLFSNLKTAIYSYFMPADH